MKAASCIFMFMCCQMLCALTNIPAGNISGVFTLSGSPYMINGDITIPNGHTLSISPGVQVIFTGAWKLAVDGRLLANGTPADSILFSTSDAATTWKGIRFYATSAANDSSFINYCILEKGNATGTSEPFENYGGALCVTQFSKLHLEHSRFSNNHSTTGGGACYFYRDDITVLNCIFSYNSTDGNGGGIESESLSDNHQLSKIRIYNCEFDHNSTQWGGGIYISTSEGSLIGNCRVDRNSSYGGGGVLISWSENCSVTGCNITKCVSNSRGGGILSENSSATFSNNSISGCYYTWDMDNPKGMGINVENGGPYIICNNNIFNNLAEYTFAAPAGGVRIINCSYQLVGNAIYNNQGSKAGGVLAYSWIQGNKIWNNTITNNYAGYTGGIWVEGYADIRNNIVWGNHTSYGQIQVSSDGTNQIWAYNDIQGGLDAYYIPNSPNWQVSTQYVNNIDAYPQFLSPTTFLGTGTVPVTTNWAIPNTSPCRNSGDPLMNLGVFTSDLAGNNRIDEERIDIGAYEYQNPLQPPQPVTISESGSLIKLSWNPVTQATGYSIYCSDNPYSGFTLLDNNPTHFILENGQISWSGNGANSLLFYKVRSIQN